MARNLIVGSRIFHCRNLFWVYLKTAANAPEISSIEKITINHRIRRFWGYPLFGQNRKRVPGSNHKNAIAEPLKPDDFFGTLNHPFCCRSNHIDIFRWTMSDLLNYHQQLRNIKRGLLTSGPIYVVTPSWKRNPGDLLGKSRKSGYFHETCSIVYFDTHDLSWSVADHVPPREK